MVKPSRGKLGAIGKTLGALPWQPQLFISPGASQAPGLDEQSSPSEPYMFWKAQILKIHIESVLYMFLIFWKMFVLINRPFKGHMAGQK
jgi:hypothetical protein